MPEPVEKRLAALPTLNKAALYDLWKQFFHSAPSSQLRRDLMIPILLLSNACLLVVSHGTF
jgi:hypothetical protein